MADASLIVLAEEVRGKTLRLLDHVDEPYARFAAPRTNNTILWHAGHALALVEHLCVAPLTGATTTGYPPEWFEKFNWQSDPATVTSWPTLAAVRVELARQLERLVAALGSADDSTLARRDRRGGTIRYLIVHGLHDEANHQGEMYLLMKMAGRGVKSE